MLLKVAFLFISLSAELVNSASILFINPSPSYSHQIAFNHLLKELSLRGHKVTTITSFPINNSSLTNLTEISLFDTRDRIMKLINIAGVVHSDDIFSVNDFLWEASVIVVKEALSQKPVQDLLSSPQTFDLVIVKYYYPNFLALGRKYNCPTITVSSYFLDDYFYYISGNPVNPVAHPNMMIPAVERLTFQERLMSVLHTIYRWYGIRRIYLPDFQSIMEEHFNMSVPIDDLIDDVDLTFVSVHPVLQEIRALGPNTITIGHSREPTVCRPLPTDLKRFMDNAEDGFIYFSLGSNVKSENLDRKLLRVIVEGLKELPIKVMWKFEGELEHKPKNVYLIKWAPQHEVLRHPNIKLFITQGGFQSMEEAIYSAVPMVVIPFFVDQRHNAKLIEKKGVGKIVRRASLTKEDFMNSINEVLNNSSYKENVTKLRKLAFDVPMDGLEKAIWWIEYVIRNKGAKHLRNPVVDVPLYQYFLLDVICFLVLVLLATIFIACLVVRFLLNRFVTTTKLKYNKNE
uniref:UDP-glucuronosyltransferase n=1 Tax=Xylotrechus quadripes TaxID=554073 RepID=A0A6G7SEM8_9CUCU|nr:UDP-glycosyltransferase [Xylotrechus quadripes]